MTTTATTKSTKTRIGIMASHDSAEEGIKKIKQYTDIGFTDIVLINSSPDRNNLVRLLSDKIIAQLRD